MASTSPYSFGKLQMKLLNSTREIAYGVGTLIVLGAGVYGYVYYKEQARDAAQVVLAQALDDMKIAWVQLIRVIGRDSHCALSFCNPAAMLSYGPKKAIGIPFWAAFKPPCRTTLGAKSPPNASTAII